MAIILENIPQWGRRDLEIVRVVEGEIAEVWGRKYITLPWGNRIHYTV